MSLAAMGAAGITASSNIQREPPQQGECGQCLDNPRFGLWVMVWAALGLQTGLA